ncbi:MAG TPA: TetR/AcrR family transcriptional regulator, partial [Candidatus Barnesiella excrementipullorum]|nr:TetR/AcrR family transcriptional regulator [Candidatus Barnesiella excrementipullorum]
RTKEKMFQAVFSDIVETFIPDIQSIAESDLPFIDKLKAIIDKYIATFAQNPDVPCFIINEIERDPQHLLATAQELHYDKFLKTLHQSMLKEIEAGKIKPIAPEKMFCTFYGLLVFPIVSKKVTKIIFFDNQESDYQEFMQNWKEHIIRIMQNLISL